MTRDPLDRLESAYRELEFPEPPGDFTARVMQSVRSEPARGEAWWEAPAACVGFVAVLVFAASYAGWMPLVEQTLRAMARQTTWTAPAGALVVAAAEAIGSAWAWVVDALGQGSALVPDAVYGYYALLVALLLWGGVYLYGSIEATKRDEHTNGST